MATKGQILKVKLTFHWSIYALIDSSVHPPIYLFTHYVYPPFKQSPIPSFIHLFTHSSIYSISYTFISLFIYSSVSTVMWFFYSKITFPDILSKIILQALSLSCPYFLFLPSTYPDFSSCSAIMCLLFQSVSTASMHSFLWWLFVECLLCAELCCRQWEHRKGQVRQKSSPLRSWYSNWGHRTINNKCHK